jgi:regulator of protease activity HflC (stomatin/prohibitin superfamily)
MLENLSAKQAATAIFVALLLVFGLGSMGKMVEFNDAGVYQVKQSVNGELTVITSAGPYFQGWGTITSYNAAELFDFNKEDGETLIKVRFSDGGTAVVPATVQFVLPNDPESILKIHQFFKTPDALRSRVLTKTFAEAVQQTASLMKSEESYSTRRSEFKLLIEEQLRRGVFETEAIEAKEADVDGNQFNDTNIVIKKNAKGEKLIVAPSPLIQYGITVGQVNVGDFDYDETIDALIQKKKEAEQQKVVARANAERSKQDKISAEQKALADVAIAKGQEEVEKIKAVTSAQKEKEVAILSAQKDFETSKLARETAEQDAKASEVAGRAEALVAQLKVNAGLTPQEKATFDKETRIGVAAEIAKTKFPSTMIISGGGGGNGGSSPMEALGMNALYDLSQKMSNSK